MLSHLSREHDGIVGLTHLAVQYALDEIRAVTQGQEHQGLALSTQPTQIVDESFPKIVHNN